MLIHNDKKFSIGIVVVCVAYPVLPEYFITLSVKRKPRSNDKKPLAQSHIYPSPLIQSKNGFIGELTAGIAHEISEPLNFVGIILLKSVGNLLMK